MEEALPDITVAGHFAIDTIRLPNIPHPFVMLGGSVAYVSLVAKRLEANVQVISRIGGDFPQAYTWWLKQENIDLSGVVKYDSETTTRFALEYSDDLSERTLKLKSRALPLELKDLPANLNAKAIHVAPIAGEIAVDLVEHLRGCTDVLSLDPQGMLRRFDSTGNASGCSLFDMRLLELVDVYKSSADEICVLTGQSELEEAIKIVHKHGVKTVIVTIGGKGAMLSVEKTVYNIPACQPNAFVDPTGAGDAFIGGFLIEFVRAKDSFWCACVGSAAASFVVESLGLTCLGTKEEIYERANVIYEK